MELSKVMSAQTIFKHPFLYLKRKGDTFYFKNNHAEFNVTLEGEELKFFEDQYEEGDKIIFVYPLEMILN